MDEMDRRGVPFSPINTYDQTLSDPQVETMKLVRTLRLPNGVKTRTTVFPLSMSRYEFDVHQHPPMLGEHTEEVFEEWLNASSEEPAVKSGMRGS